MKKTRTQLKHAVAAYLRSLAWPVPVIVVSDRLRCNYHLEDLSTVRITVLPSGLTSEIESRDSAERSLSIAIAVQQKIDHARDLDQVEELCDLVESIMGHLENLSIGQDVTSEGLALADWATLDAAENDEAYDLDELGEGVFSSGIFARFFVHV